MFQTGIQAQMTMAIKYFMNPFFGNDPKIGGGGGGGRTLMSKDVIITLFKRMKNWKQPK